MVTDKTSFVYPPQTKVFAVRRFLEAQVCINFGEGGGGFEEAIVEVPDRDMGFLFGANEPLLEIGIYGVTGGLAASGIEAPKFNGCGDAFGRAVKTFCKGIGGKKSVGGAGAFLFNAR